MKNLFYVIAVLLIAAVSTAEYIETWDTFENGVNNWMRYISTPGGPEDVLVDYQFWPMGGTGYVRSTLDDLDTDFANADTAFALYTYDGSLQVNPREEYQNINLNDNKQISIDIRLGSGASIANGEFRFFIGEWIEDGQEDKYAFWVYNQPLAYSTSWTTNVIDISDGDWIELAYGGYAPGEVTPEDLYDNPQQYGFTIYQVGQGQLSGYADFDNFMSIPEPGSLLIFSIALLPAIKRRKK